MKQEESITARPCHEIWAFHSLVQSHGAAGSCNECLWQEPALLEENEEHHRLRKCLPSGWHTNNPTF